MFTGLGKILAILGLLVGGFSLGMSFYLDGLPPEEKLRYLLENWGGSTSTGDMADLGIMMLFASVALGILAEISKKLDK